MCTGSQARCCCTCQSYDLGLAASRIWSSSPGGTLFFLTLQQDCEALCCAVSSAVSSQSRALQRTQQQFEELYVGMEGLFLQ